MKIHVSSIIVSSMIIFSLSACDSAPQRDYESSAACDARGLKAGMPGYDDCIREEWQAREMKRQRDEYEEQKRQDQFWREHRR